MITERGCEIVAVSTKMGEMFKAAKRGLSDTQVMAITGLTRTTWRNLLNGEVVGVPSILKAARGLGMDIDAVLQAAYEVTAKPDPYDTIGYILRTELHLGAKECLEITRHITEIAHAANQESKEAAA